jgi:glyoxylase-like metal-dependent hydrolase (beta-lactamase superfamily II)
VLSHGHWDHVQNVDFFQEARVLLHADELDNLENPPSTDLGTPRWARRILDDLDVQVTGEDDEPLPGVKVLDLPGHTPGSIGLAVSTEAGTAVLSADAVPTLEVLRARTASGRPYDRARADASIERVVELADLVYPGHDAPFRLDASGVPQYLDPPVPLTFGGRSQVTSEAAV